MPQQHQPEQTPESEERVNFSARVRASVRKRAKLYAAQNDVSLQDLVDAALDDYLSRHNA
ncbi:MULTISPECIES: hypothetical protein [Streptomyces]|uniref:CopG family transcriptional regulator n=1 Tax=Streptomyces sp. NBC_00148 TaxID=2903626 RepID=A0AAU1M4M9_9ACTN